MSAQMERINFLRNQVLEEWRNLKEEWKRVNIIPQDQFAYFSDLSLELVESRFSQIDQLIKYLNTEIDYTEEDYIRPYFHFFGNSLDKIRDALRTCINELEIISRSSKNIINFEIDLREKDNKQKTHILMEFMILFLNRILY